MLIHNDGVFCMRQTDSYGVIEMPIFGLHQKIWLGFFQGKTHKIKQVEGNNHNLSI